MKEKSWVRELMLPLADYASVGIDGTLQDALEALDEAQASVRPGRQPHRAILVTDPKGRIVGKLGYHTILSALLPQQEQQSVFSGDAMRIAGLTDDLMATSMRHLHAFKQDLPNLCDRARSIPIRGILQPKPATISTDATLHEVLSAFVENQATSLLAVEGGEAHGVVRVSDLFDDVTRAALGKDVGGCNEESLEEDNA